MHNLLYKFWQNRTLLLGTALCTSNNHTPANPVEMPFAEKNPPVRDRETGFTFVMSVTRNFKSLSMHNQHVIWHHNGHVFVCNGCGKKFHTNIIINTHKKLLLVGQGPPSRRLSLIWTWLGGGKKEDGSGQLQEESSYPPATSLEISCNIILKKCLQSIYLSQDFLFLQFWVCVLGMKR